MPLSIPGPPCLNKGAAAGGSQLAAGRGLRLGQGFPRGWAAAAPQGPEPADWACTAGPALQREGGPFAQGDPQGWNLAFGGLSLIPQRGGRNRCHHAPLWAGEPEITPRKGCVCVLGSTHTLGACPPNLMHPYLRSRWPGVLQVVWPFTFLGSPLTLASSRQGPGLARVADIGRWAHAVCIRAGARRGGGPGRPGRPSPLGERSGPSVSPGESGARAEPPPPRPRLLPGALKAGPRTCLHGSPA